MKKISCTGVWLIVSAILFPAGSCKKKYECHCEGPGGNPHEHYEIKAKNKSEADKECEKKKTGSFTSCQIE